MMQRYRLTTQAEADVSEIWLYIAMDNIEAADRVVDRFTQTLQRIADHAGIGTDREEYRPGLRSFPVGNYVIFYHEIKDGIEVFRVLHGARYLEDLL